MNLQKIYQPLTIPNQNRDSEIGKRATQESKQNEGNYIDLKDDPFTEIEVFLGIEDHRGEDIVQTQSIYSAADQERTLFYSMRQIAKDISFYSEGHSKVFYYQAQFMKDFEDDYTESEPFFSYYPYYYLMGYEQLRTYFTWRSLVRKGNVTNISTSYAFLYIYELLNNIGVTDPQDGLDQFIRFWKAFRAFDNVLDRYVLQWIKDYHIYYPLAKPFSIFANENNLRNHYPTVFGYEPGQDGNFDIYADISKYPIKKSIFYNEQNCQMIHDCFDFIINRFRYIFAEKQMRFEDLVFCSQVRESTWIPFSRSLFFPVLEQPDRQVILSEGEIYHCQNNRWTYKTVILSDSGRQMIGYIMKEMESSLRKATKFKHKLNANTNMCDRMRHNKFEAMGVSLPKLIQECVSEFLSILNRKTVSVDVEKLKQIRKEALQTQEKLIVFEKENMQEKSGANEKSLQDKVVQDKVVQDKSLQDKATQVNITQEKATCESLVQVVDLLDAMNIENANQITVDQKPTDEESKSIQSQLLNQWTVFKISLTPIELEALTIILQEEDIKGFAIQNRVMLEVLLDGINQKAMDSLGDAVLELDCAVIIYEEYRIKLMEMVGN